jgi:hypothetical protein
MVSGTLDRDASHFPSGTKSFSLSFTHYSREENKIYANGGGAERGPRGGAASARRTPCHSPTPPSHPLAQLSCQLAPFLRDSIELQQFIPISPSQELPPRNQGQARTKNHPRPLRIAQTSVSARRGRAPISFPRSPPPTGNRQFVAFLPPSSRASVNSSSSGSSVPDFRLGAVHLAVLDRATGAAEKSRLLFARSGRRAFDPASHTCAVVVPVLIRNRKASQEGGRGPRAARDERLAMATMRARKRCGEGRSPGRA